MKRMMTRKVRRNKGAGMGLRILSIFVLSACLQCVGWAETEWKATLDVTDEPLTNSGRNAYFILEPGYQLVLDGKEGGKHVELIITVLNETLDVGGVNTRVVEERESTDGKVVEVSRNYFAVGTTTKNVYYFGEDVDLYQQTGAGVTHEGSWRAGRDGAKHGIMIPGTIKVGDRYYQEYAPKVAMDRGENMSINAGVRCAKGNLHHCLKVKETTPLEDDTDYKFYAPGIGLAQEGRLKLVKRGFLEK